ncbi:hypothetical protein Tco_0366697 [Tanacetum coccineum]
MVVDEGEPTGSTALEATIATGSRETIRGGRLYPELMYPRVIKEGTGPELICTGAGGDTGLGDERSMTEVFIIRSALSSPAPVSFIFPTLFLYQMFTIHMLPTHRIKLFLIQETPGLDPVPSLENALGDDFGSH